MSIDRSPAAGVTVLFPAYNEEAAIPQTLEQTKAVMDATGWPYEILVIDDGSKDRTVELSLKHGARVIRHRRNFGVGRGRLNGIIHAKYEMVVMADADGTYPLADLPKLCEVLTDCDQVVGARVKEMGTHRAVRTFVKTFIRSLASFITRTHIPDLNSGMRAVRRPDVLRFANILPEGHSWVSTITIAFLSNGYEVRFVPIDYYERIGRSTFTMFGDTANYLMLVIKTVMYFNPLRFFMPLGVSIGVLGFLKTIYDWLVLSDVKESDIAMLILSMVVLSIGLLADLSVAHNRRAYMKPLDTDHTATLPELLPGNEA